MLRKYLLGSLTFTLAFAVLSLSVLKSSSIKYVFGSTFPVQTLGEKDVVEIDYQLPYPGRILPDSLFWPAKALRDKVLLSLTFDKQKRAERILLFSDKRLVMSKTLFERQKPELAFSTLTKAEKYLQLIDSDNPDFLVKLTNASLKHRQVMDEILALAPEDARPGVIKTQDYSKSIYVKTSEVLSSKGIKPPINPFEGDK